MNRNNLVDALRGFAIVGIILLHFMEHFNCFVFPPASEESLTMANINKQVWDTMYFLFESKTFSIFALLFGFTFHLQYQKQLALGKDFGIRFLWRMLILFAFGWINAILFYGEILLIYAALSPILFFIRKLNTKSIFIISLFFMAQPYLLFSIVASHMNPDFTQFSMFTGEDWQVIYNNLNHGNLINMASQSWLGFKGSLSWAIGNGRVSQTLGLFGLGLVLGRKNRLNSEPDTFPFWKKALILSAILFTAFLIAEPHTSELRNKYIVSLFVAWRKMTQFALMVSLFIVLYKTRVFQRLVKPLQNYGRMSLTNYMLQSLIGGLLFYNYGFKLAPHINVTYSLLLGIGVVSLLIIACNWWIKKYRQGPLEKLWHKITWMSFKDQTRHLLSAHFR